MFLCRNGVDQVTLIRSQLSQLKRAAERIGVDVLSYAVETAFFRTNGELSATFIVT